MEREDVITQFRKAMLLFLEEESRGESDEESQDDRYLEGHLDGIRETITVMGVMTEAELDELSNSVKAEYAELQRVIKDLEKRGYVVEKRETYT